MEPWMAEERRQRQLDRYWAQQPRCVVCERTIRSEQCLALDAFGLSGCACETCVNSAMRYTEDMEN